jgi:hypothetical protein
MGSTDLGSSSARGFVYITASDTHVKDKPLYLNLYFFCKINDTLFRNYSSNVCPCVPRRTPSRDKSIVYQSQLFSWQVYEFVLKMLLSLTIFPKETT